MGAETPVRSLVSPIPDRLTDVDRTHTGHALTEANMGLIPVSAGM